MIKASTLPQNETNVLLTRLDAFAAGLGYGWDGETYVKLVLRRKRRVSPRNVVRRVVESSPDWWESLFALEIGGDIDITVEAARLKKDTKKMQDRIYQHTYGNPSTRHSHKFIVRHVAKRMIATRVTR